MSTQTQLSPEPHKKSCLERAIIFFIRLLFALVVGIAMGVGIYFGIRLLYNEYRSVTQEYDSRITALETVQSESGQQVAERLSGFQTRLETLEIQGDTQKNAFSDLESRLDSHDEFRSYHATVVADQQVTLLGIQDTILAMQTEVNLAQSELEELQNSLTGFQEDLLALQTNTAAIADTVAEEQSALETINEMVLDIEVRMTVLEQQMVFLRAMELLTRARLNLVQGNATLAQNDIETARDLLVKLAEGLPPLQAAYLAEITAAIEDTLSYLPGAPLTAADKSESVWLMLVVGLPDEADLNADQASKPETSQENTPTATPPVTPTPKP